MQTLGVARTGMAVTIDIGEANCGSSRSPLPDRRGSEAVAEPPA